MSPIRALDYRQAPIFRSNRPWIARCCRIGTKQQDNQSPNTNSYDLLPIDCLGYLERVGSPLNNNRSGIFGSASRVDASHVIGSLRVCEGHTNAQQKSENSDTECAHVDDAR